MGDNVTPQLTAESSSTHSQVHGQVEQPSIIHPHTTVVLNNDAATRSDSNYLNKRARKRMINRHRPIKEMRIYNKPARAKENGWAKDGQIRSNRNGSNLNVNKEFHVQSQTTTLSQKMLGQHRLNSSSEDELGEKADGGTTRGSVLCQPSRDDHISSKLAWLRKELTLMRKQDEALLAQFLQIHDAIIQLSRYRSLRRRKPAAGPAPLMKSESMRETRKTRQLVVPKMSTRVHSQSDPNRLNASSDEDLQDSSEPPEYYYAQDSLESLDSSLSSLIDSNELDKNIESELADMLTPLPGSHIKRSLSVTEKDTTRPHLGNTSITRYDTSYEELMKRSKIWRQVQRQIEEKGSVDERKMAALKLIL